MSEETKVEKCGLLNVAMLENPGRPPMNQEQYDKEYGDTTGEKTSSVRKICRQLQTSYCYPFTGFDAFLSTIIGFIPIIGWLPKYDFRNQIAGDIIGGLTTGIMHVPQGIAYSVLAGVDPVYGLYSSCFPAFFYMFFGTSRHASIGSFAVIALMGGLANDKVMEVHGQGGSVTFLANGTVVTELNVTPIQVAATLTFSLGIWQFLCGVFRLQFLMAYFSDPLVSGFTTGAAVHVLLAQIDDILGIKVPKASGPGYIFVRIYDLCIRLPECNFYAIIISIFSMAFLYLGKETLSPWLSKKFNLRIPIPYELLLVVATTIFSFLFEWNDEHDVIIVGDIPAGLPVPQLPRWHILKDCMIQSLGIAVVTIAVHISMAKMLAKKLGYTIDDNQELYALGMTGILSGFLPVYPISTALGRTMVNVKSGTFTQLSTVFSSGLLLAIILWAGPLLSDLPKCVLASIITMALQSMFQKKEELKALYPISKIDFTIWIVSFLSTVCIDVMEGLAISILAALVSIVFRSQWPRWEFFLRSNDNENVVDCENGKVDADNWAESFLQSADICLFRFDGPLLFTNVERFKKSLKTTFVEWEANSSASKSKLPRFFIIDCSSMSCSDYMGINALKDMSKELQGKDVTVYVAGANGSVRRKMESSEFYSILSKDHLFPTLKDAILIAKRNGNAVQMLSTAKKIQLQRLSSNASNTDTPPGLPVINGNALNSIENAENGINEQKIEKSKK